MHLILLKFVLCSIKSRARYVWSMQSQFDSRHGAGGSPLLRVDAG